MAKKYVRKTNEERKQEIEKITKDLDDQVRKLFDSETYKNYLKTMSRFHNYSFNNTMLIALQKPDATLVAGYSTWKEKFHRYVKKGEKGIKILAPAPIKKEKETPVIDPNTKRQLFNTDGTPMTEKVQVTIPMFKVAYIYDYSQTEGEELPSIGVNELKGKVDGYARIIKAVEAVSPVPVNYENIRSGAKGYYSLAEKKIAVQAGMSELQTLKTLVHEISHGLLHDDTGAKVEGVDDQKKTRNTKEVEAESIAYTVLSFLGLDKTDGDDVGDYSFGYILGWSSGKDLKELKESMETIRATSSYIITKIEDRLLEKTSIRDKLHTMENSQTENKLQSTEIRRVRNDPALSLE